MHVGIPKCKKRLEVCETRQRSAKRNAFEKDNRNMHVHAQGSTPPGSFADAPGFDIFSSFAFCKRAVFYPWTYHLMNAGAGEGVLTLSCDLVLRDLCLWRIIYS